MNETPTPAEPADWVDASAGLAEPHPVWALRRLRPKIVEATQGSHTAMFTPALPGLPRTERLLVALRGCRVAGAETLAALYRSAALAAGAAPGLLAEADDPALPGAPQPATPVPPAGRLATLLDFCTRLMRRPIDGDRAAVQRLQQAGLDTAAIVALGQLIAFLSYQVRLVAGLQALVAAGAADAPDAPAAATLDAAAPMPAAPPAGSVYTVRGFTNAVLDWTPWIPAVDPTQATPEQLAALDAMSPQARSSAYFLLLAHQPEMLLQRSIAFNTIMYAPGGLSRAERELGATVESRLNGCVYCASVHAQRFEQLAKRNDVLVQLFEDPQGAGTTPRERAVVQLSARLALQPAQFSAAEVQLARSVGLTDAETLDLVHAVALFAWANRLMLNLGEPVHADGRPAERGQL